MNVATTDNYAPQQALRLAAAIERDSEHTIAKGIVKTAEERKLAIPQAQGFEAIPGRGVKASVEVKYGFDWGLWNPHTTIRRQMVVASRPPFA